MTNLHEELAAISERVRSVDLYERSLRRSNQIGRRRAAAGIGGTALGIVLIVLLAWQLGARPLAAPPPVPATNPPTTDVVVPTPTVSTDPTPAPTPPSRLANATLTAPAWPRYELAGGCGTGPFRLVDGQAQVNSSLSVWLGSWAEVSLNGAMADVATLHCFGPGENSVSQVLAYRRTASGHTLIGRVVATDGVDRTGFDALAPAGTNEVMVEVLDQFIGGTDPPSFAILRQQRTYRLVGNAFQQVAGETTFRAGPAGITVEASALTFAESQQGCRSGSMTITVHNGGTKPAVDLRAVVRAPLMEAGDCPAAPGQDYDSLSIGIGTLAAGESRTVTVPAITPHVDAGTEDNPYNIIYLRTGTQQFAATTHFVIVYQ